MESSKAQRLGVCWILLLLTATLRLCESVWVKDRTAIVEENVKDVFIYNGTYNNDNNCQKPSITVSPEDTFNVTDPVQDGNSWTVKVMLVKPLDAEKAGLVMFELNAQTTCGSASQSSTLDVSLEVKDTLDNPPRFQKDTYTVYVNETTPAGTLIVTGIKAEDTDEYDDITYTVNFSPADGILFNYTEAAGVVSIFLKQSLDFETTRSHTFTITATDSVDLSSTCDVIINVRNMLDTRPVFSQTVYFASVVENVPEATPVIQVSAFDGDAADDSTSTGSVIRYSILKGGAGMFQVDPVSGEVTTAGQIDAENSEFDGGPVQLVIMAKEEPSGGTLSQGDTNATVTLHVNIVDLDDNPPEFNAVAFTGSIWEQAELGDFISLVDPGFMSVHDLDVGATNNQFMIYLERNGAAWDVFTPSVQSGQGYVTVLLKLTREGELTGLAGSEITFQVLARPLSGGGPVARSTVASVADVTLSVSSSQTLSQVSRTGDEEFSTAETVIVVLVIALIVFIIVATIYYVVRKTRREKSQTMPVFRKNSKYYVSKRNSSVAHLQGSETNVTSGADSHTEAVGVPRRSSNEKSTTHTPSTDVYEPYMSQRKREELVESPTVTESSVLESSSQMDTLDRTDKHTVTAAVNRNRCDLTLLVNKTRSLTQAEKQGAYGEVVSEGVERTEAQARSQNTLLSLLNTQNSTDRCDVTSLTEAIKSVPTQVSNEAQPKTSSSGYVNIIQVNMPDEEPQKPLCDVAPIDQTLDENAQFASDLQNKVNQMLATGRDVDRLTKNCEVVPFSEIQDRTGDTRQVDNINTSLSSDQVQSESRKSSFSNTSTTDVAPLIKDKEISKNKKPQILKETKPKVNGVINPIFANHSPAIQGSNSVKTSNPKGFITPSNVTKIPVSPLVPKRVVTGSRNQLVATPGSQLSQPNVPPVALALPSFTGPPPSLAEEYVVIINPVYEPHTAASGTLAPTEDKRFQKTSTKPKPAQPTRENIQENTDMLTKSPSEDYMTKAKNLLSEVASSMLANGKSCPRSASDGPKSVKIMDSKKDTLPEGPEEKLTKF